MIHITWGSLLLLLACIKVTEWLNERHDRAVRKAWGRVDDDGDVS